MRALGFSSEGNKIATLRGSQRWMRTRFVFYGDLLLDPFLEGNVYVSNYHCPSKISPSMKRLIACLNASIARLKQVGCLKGNVVP